jgi:hypothetical protein
MQTAIITTVQSNRAGELSKSLQVTLCYGRDRVMIPDFVKLLRANLSVRVPTSTLFLRADLLHIMQRLSTENLAENATINARHYQTADQSYAI